MPDLRPVILSGGAGTRLWPLSTADIPKQFTPLFGTDTLFSLTLRRLGALADLDGIVVVTGERFFDLVAGELSSASVEATVIVEPEGRNTAPAAIAAALASEDDDLILLLPADHLITDAQAFGETVAMAVDVASNGYVVTFGIRPSRPETGYGYIEMGEIDGTARVVNRFKEKPDESEAGELAADGLHLWNSGMFLVRAATMLEEARAFCPEILDAVERSLPAQGGSIVRLSDAFLSAPSISFDHAIMEHTRAARVLEGGFGWTDVGSYDALLAASQRDRYGNSISGDVTLADVKGSYVKATSRRLVVAGLEDVVVVETPEAVLVLSLDKAQEVRDLRRRVTGD